MRKTLLSLTTLPLAALCLTLLAPTAAADIIALKDGRVLEGPKMSREGDFVVVHFEHGDVKVPNSLVQVLVSENASEYVPTTDEEKQKFEEEGLVLHKGKWIPLDKYRKQMEREMRKLKKQVEEDQAHSEWRTRREDESKNFRWAYTVPEHIKEAFVERCEAYYEIFCKDWRVSRDKRKPKMMMNFFRNGEEFQRVGGAGGGALAYFMFLGDYDLCLFYDSTSMEFTEMVLYHELSHYLQKLLNEDFKIPHWPGEGVSEYYGGALWDEDKGKMDIGLIQEGRLVQVKEEIALGQRLKLKDVVTKDAYTDYTWGWTLVHFLMSTDHRKGFQDYLKGIATDRGVDRTPGPFNLSTITPEESLRYLMECLDLNDDEDLAELEQEWYDYIDNELKLDSVSGLEKAAVGALNVGKPIKATRLFQEALDAGSQNPAIFHRYAQLLKNRGERSKAEELYERALELDPLRAIYWWEYGRLVERNDEDEGERLKNLAREIDPQVDKDEWDLGELTGGSEDD